VRQDLPLVSAQRVDGCEIREGPARGPRLSEIEREPPALLGCRVRELELAAAEKLRGLRPEGIRQGGDQCSLASHADGAVGVRQAVTPDALTAGGQRRRDQALRIVETLRDLNRFFREFRSARVITRELGGKPGERGDDEAIDLGDRPELRRALAELDHLVDVAGKHRRIGCLAEHLQGQRHVLGLGEPLGERRDRFREPSASPLDNSAQVEQPRVRRLIDERHGPLDQAAGAIDLARPPGGLRRPREAPSSR
jgi:hypothetical protein